jgi:OHCU decarboxylase
MRADPSEYDLVAPGSLQEVITLLAREPGVWMPIAGGTDVMVQYGAGTLRARKLVSIWNLRELRVIEESAEEFAIGAACTYTDMRKNTGLATEFPLLAQAASWTGGIVNQNRGTLGGNIANASPAADCLPALLAYDAELTLTSIRGSRKIAYRNFHTDYKKMAKAADELIHTIHLKKKFASYVSHARKVGARQSQAIAKVCIAALGEVAHGKIADVRIALGSVAPVPLRLIKTELAVIGRTPDALSLDKVKQDIKQLVATEIAPIADIRSTADYRMAVAGNLVIEFLEKLRAADRQTNPVLERWNRLDPKEAMQIISSCCGAKAWIETITARRPFHTVDLLQETSKEIWQSLNAADWLEAFRSHPRIGESRPAPSASEKSQAWSSQEQRRVSESDEDTKRALAEGNRQYENRFGRTFIVCASGKSPREILEILQRRLQLDDAADLQEAADEQQKITQLRLRKWLEG